MGHGQCLLPLANTPLIEYTLEFLAMNGVQEVYIYCGAHTDQVEEYIAHSRWATTSKSSPFSVVQFVRVSDARSVGDVLRDMDKRSLVDGDFILVHGDLVSNIMLDGVLAEHRKRRIDNAANIMTLVLTSGGLDDHRTKTNAITPIFAIDAKNKRCLHYDEMHPLQSEHYVSLDPAIPDELSTDFELRGDLIDAQIDICTPEVLALWSESFDYELPRKNFLHGVLKDWELNGKMIYAEVLDDGYAARASNLQMYNSVSQDILGRWASPFIPENNIVPRHKYTRHRNGVMVEKGVSLAPDAQLTNSIIGHRSRIGAGSKISNTIIGKDCQIGANVTLKDCFVWDDAVIEDGTWIGESILADGVVVGKNCAISDGTLLSFGVQISDNTALSAGAIVSTVSSSNEPVTKDTSLLGPNTNAAPFIDSEDEDADEEDPSCLQKSFLYSHPNISNSSVSTLASSTDDDVRRTGFHGDAVDGLIGALRGGSDDFDGAKLEFMGLRLANDASDYMMRDAVATAFARRAVELMTPEYGSLEPTKAAEKSLTFSNGASKFVDEVGVGGGDAEQIEFIICVQKALQNARGVEAGKAGTLLAALLQKLYALDILEEEGILGWWVDPRAVEEQGLVVLKEKCKVLVEWLENASEEEDSSEGESDNE